MVSDRLLAQGKNNNYNIIVIEVEETIEDKFSYKSNHIRNQ